MCVYNVYNKCFMHIHSSRKQYFNKAPYFFFLNWWYYCTVGRKCVLSGRHISFCPSSTWETFSRWCLHSDMVTCLHNKMDFLKHRTHTQKQSQHRKQTTSKVARSDTEPMTREQSQTSKVSTFDIDAFRPTGQVYLQKSYKGSPKPPKAGSLHTRNRAEVAKLMPGGHMWSDELYNPGCRAFTTFSPNAKWSLIG